MSEFKKSGISEETNKITEAIVDSAYTVHKTMGPGLLENIYESCLVKEFQKRNIRFERQKQVPVFYGDE
jgi:GxxExxY protein